MFGKLKYMSYLCRINLKKCNMNKFYTIEFEAEYTEDNCMEGTFNEETVIEDVKQFLEDRYGGRLKYFVIQDEDEECIYDSQNIITTI